ncbi:MAG: IclR family transcriptional regulator [Spirochaetes bacterium]|nr:IclR family transcriptional regulator [Spirochaetota bacterium]
MKIKKGKLIQSITKAHDILSMFVNDKRPLGISDFSRRLSLPKTTVQGIVNTLCHLGYLEKDHHSGKYRLGPYVFQLGMKYATNLDLVSIGRVWAERLCFQFRQPVNIGMLVGDKVVVVLRVEPENRFMSYPQAGSVIPTHTTCIGKLLCAYMDKKRLDEILASYEFQPLTKNSITTAQEFLQELEKVRSMGISFDNQESVMGLAGIGGPIFNYTGQIIAAFAITGDAEFILHHKQDIIQAVRDTSLQLSVQLGYNP